MIDGASLGVSVGLMGADVATRGIMDLSSAFQTAGAAAVGLYADFEGLQISMTQLAKTQLNAFGMMKSAKHDIQAQFDESKAYSKGLVDYAMQRALSSSYSSSDISYMLQTAMSFGMDAVQIDSIIEAQDRGVITAKRLTDALVNFGAAQAVANYDLKQIMLTMGKTFEDKYQAVEIDILTERGIPVERLLADALKKTKPEIKKMRAEGQLTDELVTPIIVEWIEKTYPGAAEQMAGTTAGLLAQIGDVQSVRLAQAYGPAIEVLKEPVADLIAYLQSDEASAAIQRFASKVADISLWVADAARDVLSFFRLVYDKWDGIASAMKVSATFGALTSMGQILSSAFLTMLKVVTSPAVMAFSRLFINVAPSVMLFTNLIRDDLIPTISSLHTHINVLTVATAGMFFAHKIRDIGDAIHFLQGAHKAYSAAYSTATKPLVTPQFTLPQQLPLPFGGQTIPQMEFDGPNAAKLAKVKEVATVLADHYEGEGRRAGRLAGFALSSMDAISSKGKGMLSGILAVRGFVTEYINPWMLWSMAATAAIAAVTWAATEAHQSHLRYLDSVTNRIMDQANSYRYLIDLRNEYEGNRNPNTQYADLIQGTMDAGNQMKEKHKENMTWASGGGSWWNQAPTLYASASNAWGEFFGSDIADIEYSFPYAGAQSSIGLDRERLSEQRKKMARDLEEYRSDEWQNYYQSLNEDHVTPDKLGFWNSMWEDKGYERENIDDILKREHALALKGQGSAVALNSIFAYHSELSRENRMLLSEAMAYTQDFERMTARSIGSELLSTAAQKQHDVIQAYAQLPDKLPPDVMDSLARQIQDVDKHIATASNTYTTIISDPLAKQKDIDKALAVYNEDIARAEAMLDNIKGQIDDASKLEQEIIEQEKKQKSLEFAQSAGANIRKAYVEHADALRKAEKKASESRDQLEKETNEKIEEARKAHYESLLENQKTYVDASINQWRSYSDQILEADEGRKQARIQGEIDFAQSLLGAREQGLSTEDIRQRRAEWNERQLEGAIAENAEILQRQRREFEEQLAQELQTNLQAVQDELTKSLQTAIDTRNTSIAEAEKTHRDAITAIDQEYADAVIEQNKSFNDELENLQQQRLERLETAAKAAYDAALGEYTKSVDGGLSFVKESEKALEEWNKKRQTLVEQGAWCAIPEEEAAFAEQEAQRAAAYAKQEDELRDHLGRELIEYVRANGLKQGMSLEAIGRMTQAIARAYGVQQTLTESLFAQDAAALDRILASGGEGIDAWLDGADTRHQRAIEMSLERERRIEQESEALARQYATGAMTQAEYLAQLGKLPTRIDTELGLHTTDTARESDIFADEDAHHREVEDATTRHHEQLAQLEQDMLTKRQDAFLTYQEAITTANAEYEEARLAAEAHAAERSTEEREKIEERRQEEEKRRETLAAEHATALLQVEADRLNGVLDAWTTEIQAMEDIAEYRIKQLELIKKTYDEEVRTAQRAMDEKVAAELAGLETITEARQAMFIAEEASRLEAQAKARYDARYDAIEAMTDLSPEKRDALIRDAQEKFSTDMQAVRDAVSAREKLTAELGGDPTSGETWMKLYDKRGKEFFERLSREEEKPTLLYESPLSYPYNLTPNPSHTPPYQVPEELADDLAELRRIRSDFDKTRESVDDHVIIAVPEREPYAPLPHQSYQEDDYWKEEKWRLHIQPQVVVRPDDIRHVSPLTNIGELPIFDIPSAPPHVIVQTSQSTSPPINISITINHPHIAEKAQLDMITREIEQTVGDVLVHMVDDVVKGGKNVRYEYKPVN